MIDVYVSPAGEDWAGDERHPKIIGDTKLPEDVRVTVRGSVQAMQVVVSELRAGADPVDAAGVSDTGRAVQIVSGSVLDSAGGADGFDGCVDDSIC